MLVKQIHKSSLLISKFLFYCYWSFIWIYKFPKWIVAFYIVLTGNLKNCGLKTFEKKECYKIVQNVTCPSLTRNKITSWPPFAQYMYQEWICTFMSDKQHLFIHNQQKHKLTKINGKWKTEINMSGQFYHTNYCDQLNDNM